MKTKLRNQMSVTALAVSLFSVPVAHAGKGSRYQCKGVCVLFQQGEKNPLISGIHKLSPGKSNYSEEAAIKKLEKACQLIASRISGTPSSSFIVVGGIQSYGSKESTSQSQAVSLSDTKSRVLLGLIAYRNGHSITNASAFSSEQDATISFSDFDPKCTTNTAIPESDVEEYVGPSEMGL